MEAKRTRIFVARPPQEATAHIDWLLDLTLARCAGIGAIQKPGEAGKVRVKLALAKAKINKALNGCYWLLHAEHWCWMEGGGRCCESVADTYAKVCDAYLAVAAVIFHPGNTASESRWFKLIQGAKRCFFGLGSCLFYLRF